MLKGVNPDRPKDPPIPIVECLDCRVFRSETTEIFSDDLYPESYYGELSKDSFLNKWLIGMYQTERRRKLRIHNKSKIKILDIGCGDGTFLEQLPEYFEKFGYEPSQTGRNEVLAKKNIRLYPALDLTHEMGTFDIITFWQSLEHIAEPKALLQSAHCLLKDGGTLFISVPNIDSWQAKIFRGKWFHLDPLRHFLHYTPKTLAHLLRQNHFLPVSFDTVSWEYGLFGWWQSLYNFFGFEFNMLYKILKRWKKYERTQKNTLALAAQILLAVPFLIISILLFGLENMFQKGGVINLKTRKDSKTASCSEEIISS